jgi:5-methylcytosine-specific restriction endonuclease McrA
MSQWITRERRLAIYIRDGFACVYCQSDLRDAQPESITLDHITPRSKGGTNHGTNLVTACHNCNSTRGNRSYTKFARRFDGSAAQRINNQRRRNINLKLAKSIIEGRGAQG